MTTSNSAIGTIPFVSKQRDVTFDIMKGIGILLMFVGHFQNVGWLHQIIYSFHMPMFFLIAGYFSKSIRAVKSANGAEGGGANSILFDIQVFSKIGCSCFCCICTTNSVFNSMGGC